MKLEYLQTAEAGLRWFRRYHRQNPQLDIARAVAALRVAEATLREFPMAGERLEDLEAVREIKIIGTSFSLLHTVAQGRIFVIDLHDQRGLRSADALRAFARELRTRYGIDPT